MQGDMEGSAALTSYCMMSAKTLLKQCSFPTEMVIRSWNRGGTVCRVIFHRMIKYNSGCKKKNWVVKW